MISWWLHTHGLRNCSDKMQSNTVQALAFHTVILCQELTSKELRQVKLFNRATPETEPEPQVA